MNVSIQSINKEHPTGKIVADVNNTVLTEFSGAISQPIIFLVS